MKLSEIISICEASQVTPHIDLDQDISGGFCGDLMSDVLASIQPDSLLITGLNNPQVVRTALIADVRLLIIARGKRPAPETIKLAIAENLPVLSSKLGLYELAGRLMAAGLPSLEKPLAFNKKDRFTD